VARHSTVCGMTVATQCSFDKFVIFRSASVQETDTVMGEKDDIERLIVEMTEFETALKDVGAMIKSIPTRPKSEWPDGPWMSEPDDKKWIDEATGYHCWITRDMHSGFLCGYVGVPPDNPLYGQDDRSFDVHGGVTITGESVLDDDLWWFGFDCVHFFDLLPLVGDLEGKEADHPLKPAYRTFDYVEENCRSLAEQIALKAALTMLDRIEER